MPPFIPTDEERRQVETLSGWGIPYEQIAIMIRKGISCDTLTRHFQTELVAGKAKANTGVARTLYQKAIGGDTTAAIWWSKTQMRWAETQRHELSGRNGAPIETMTLDASKLSSEALAEILAARDSSEAP